MHNSGTTTSAAETVTFDALFRSYYAPMVVYGMRMLSCQEDAEDAVQEVFSKLLLKWGSLDVSDNPRGLLFTMLHNKILDVQSVKGRHVYTSITEIRGEMILPSVEESTYEMETYALLYKEVENLPRKNREVMRMKMKGMDNQDIAEELGISLSTVRNHVKHGVSSLRGKFDNHMLSIIFF